MVKYNYFEELEKISILTSSAVSLACLIDTEGSISDIRKNCDALVCKTEDNLFSDFLPPLERDNIAAMAHSLSRVIDTAYELLSVSSSMQGFMKSNDEGKICVQLAKELSENIALLRSIKRPDELPDIKGYRALLSEGRSAHKKMLSRIRSGSFPKSAAETVILTGKLRAELSRAFDELIEIMLNNI